MCHVSSSIMYLQVSWQLWQDLILKINTNYTMLEFDRQIPTIDQQGSLFPMKGQTLGKPYQMVLKTRHFARLTFGTDTRACAWV